MRWLVATVVAFVIVPVASALTLVLPAAAAVTPGWAFTGTMLEGRSIHSGVVLDDGRVLVASGQTSGLWSRTAEIYDPRTATWSPAGTLYAGRQDPGLVKLADGRVLMAGGQGSGVGAEVYDPRFNLWSPVGPMAESRYLAAMTLLPNGKVLIAGGWRDDGSTSATAELFDPGTGQWSSAGTMSVAAYGAAITVTPEGRVFVIGGASSTAQGGGQITVREYLGGTSWTTRRPMATARYFHTLNVLPSGKLLVAGGGGGETSAELYDVRLDTWTPTGSMRAARLLHSATTLTNGRVLAVGGIYNGGEALTELYNAQTGEWSSAGSLNLGRWEHTAAALRDGRVLIAGGYTDGGTHSPSAELWTPTTSVTTDPGLALGDLVPGTAATGVVQLTNTGDLSLLVDDFAVDGAHPGDFSVNGDRCRGGIAPGTTCLVDVRFAPTAAGGRSATLTFSSNTPGGVRAVPLSGRGVSVVGAPGPGGNGVADADADGDGVLDTTDRCSSLKGPASRVGCPAGLLADPSIAYTRSKTGIRVVAYYVKATTGARVVVKCSKGCKQTVTKGRGSRRIRIARLNGKRLRNGTSITITVSMPGRLTTTVTDRIARGRRVEGRPRCAPVGC